MILVPNSKTKRGWSTTGVKWRFDDVSQMPLTVVCQGEFYARRQEGTKWFYVYDPEPPVRSTIIIAVGGSPFWHRLMPALGPVGQPLTAEGTAPGVGGGGEPGRVGVGIVSTERFFCHGAVTRTHSPSMLDQ